MDEEFDIARYVLFFKKRWLVYDREEWMHVSDKQMFLHLFYTYPSS
jgi:hypothetical protein